MSELDRAILKELKEGGPRLAASLVAKLLPGEDPAVRRFSIMGNLFKAGLVERDPAGRQWRLTAAGEAEGG